MSTDPFPPQNECGCGKVHAKAAPERTSKEVDPEWVKNIAHKGLDLAITHSINGQPIVPEAFTDQEDMDASWGPDDVDSDGIPFDDGEVDGFGYAGVDYGPYEDAPPIGHDPFEEFAQANVLSDLPLPVGRRASTWPGGLDDEPDLDFGLPYTDALEEMRSVERITMRDKDEMLAEVAASIEYSKRVRTDINNLERKQLASKVNTLMEDTQIWLDAGEAREIAQEVFDYQLEDPNKEEAVAVGRIGDVILYNDGTAVDLSPDMYRVRAEAQAEGRVAERIDEDPYFDYDGEQSEVRVTSDSGGQKGTKPEQYDDMPMEALASLAKVYAMGAAKYERGNYRKGYPYSLSFSAMMRHLIAWQGGEDTDPESGLSHLAHAAWHCFTLQHFLSTHPEYDDRQA